MLLQLLSSVLRLSLLVLMLNLCFLPPVPITVFSTPLNALFRRMSAIGIGQIPT